MSDLIDRQQAIDALETVGYDFSESELSEVELEEVCGAVGDVRQDMIGRIKRLPPAQPEIIQCKDCKFREEDAFCTGRGFPCQLVPDDGFCDKGKKE